MRILRIRNERNIYILDDITIDGSLESMQCVVDGYIEVVTVAGNIVIVCDEAGRLKDKPISCCLLPASDYSKNIRGIYGDCFICQRDGEELVSLSSWNKEVIVNNIMADRVGVPLIDVRKLCDAVMKGGCSEKFDDYYSD